MGSSDFSSMPSEPQDIGKWFSSYVYESPQPSSADCFQDSDVSRVPETEGSEDRTEENLDKDDSLGKREILLHKCKNIARDNSPSEPPFDCAQLPEKDESEGIRGYNLDEDDSCFQDSGVSRVPETEESEYRILENLDEVDWLKTGDVLLNKGKKIAADNCSKEVLEEYAASISLVSEPPDLKNWFDSYVYESPAVDTCCEFGIWSKEDNRDEEENDAPNCSEGKKVCLSNSIQDVKMNMLASQRPTSGGLVNYVNLGENKDSQREKSSKDSQETSEIQQLDKLNDLTDQQISYQILHDSVIPEHDNGSTKHIEGSFSCSASAIESRSGEEASLLSSIICSSSSTCTTRKRWLETKHLHEQSLQSKACGNALDIAAFPENFYPGKADGKLLKRVSCANGDEESGGNEVADEGFVSTRKSRSKQANKENYFKRPTQVKPDNQRLGVANPPKGDKEALRREVLQERTNFQPPEMFEKTGKWLCPQKNKPDFGPPLKQLRLERWVRRVQKL